MKNYFIVFLFTLFLSCTTTSPPPQDLLRLPLPDTLPTWTTESGIYEIFIRNLTPEGTFQAAISQLPRIKALGVKTLWLMPFHPIGDLKHKGTLGSPYSIKDFYAVDPLAGTLEDFRSFVKAAQALDLKVILDFVASHSAWDNLWVTQHPDWYLKDSNGNVRAPGPDWTDVAGFDYKNPQLREEIIQVLSYWVEEFDIDGYRCDVAYRMPTDFWSDAIKALQKIKPVLMLAEGTEVRLVEAGFQMIYGSVGYSNLKDVFGEGMPNDFARAAFDEWTGAGGAPLLRFITNHDETSWSETPPVLFGSEEGARAAAVGTFLLPGIPMIYNGQEIASEVKANLFEKTTYDWNSSEGTSDFYSQLMTLWAGEPSFKTGTMDIQDLIEAPGVLSYARDDGNDRIIVLVNFRREEAQITLPEVWKSDKYRDLWTGESWNGGSLNAYSWRILKAQR